ncbi:hypothetical protein [Persicobacter diffluens]|uniref:hypothetical protein n=1 Tax=Persicobacter diffluens TaxID=981 RepID=UPI0030C6D9A6
MVAEFLEGRGLTLASLMGIQYVIKGGLLEPEGKQELANLLQREGWRLEWLDVHTFVISH